MTAALEGLGRADGAAHAASRGQPPQACGDGKRRSRRKAAAGGGSPLLAGPSGAESLTAPAQGAFGTRGLSEAASPAAAVASAVLAAGALGEAFSGDPGAVLPAPLVEALGVAGSLAAAALHLLAALLPHLASGASTHDMGEGRDGGGHAQGAAAKDSATPVPAAAAAGAPPTQRFLPPLLNGCTHPFQDDQHDATCVSDTAGTAGAAQQAVPPPLQAAGCLAEVVGALCSEGDRVAAARGVLHLLHPECGRNAWIAVTRAATAFPELGTCLALLWGAARVCASDALAGGDASGRSRCADGAVGPGALLHHLASDLLPASLTLAATLAALDTTLANAAAVRGGGQEGEASARLPARLTLGRLAASLARNLLAGG